MGSNRIKSEEKGIGRLAGDGVQMACVPARKARLEIDQSKREERGQQKRRRDPRKRRTE